MSSDYILRERSFQEAVPITGGLLIRVAGHRSLPGGPGSSWGLHKEQQSEGCNRCTLPGSLSFFAVLSICF